MNHYTFSDIYVMQDATLLRRRVAALLGFHWHELRRLPSPGLGGDVEALGRVVRYELLTDPLAAAWRANHCWQITPVPGPCLCGVVISDDMIPDLRSDAQAVALWRDHLPFWSFSNIGKDQWRGAPLSGLASPLYGRTLGWVVGKALLVADELRRNYAVCNRPSTASSASTRT